MAYGCYNRKPFKEGEWLHGLNSRSGLPEVIFVQNRMAKDCQYQKNDQYADPGCVGCKHKQEKIEHKNDH